MSPEELLGLDPLSVREAMLAAHNSLLETVETKYGALTCRDALLFMSQLNLLVVSWFHHLDELFGAAELAQDEELSEAGCSRLMEQAERKMEHARRRLAELHAPGECEAVRKRVLDVMGRIGATCKSQDGENRFDRLSGRKDLVMNQGADLLSAILKTNRELKIRLKKELEQA